jgi:DNA-binding CsgD family transcriptional regulator
VSAAEDFLAPLTPTERDVVLQAIYGGSNQEIADALSMGKPSVTGHLHRIYPKLEVDSRAELIAIYWQHRLRDVEDRTELRRLRAALEDLVGLVDAHAPDGGSVRGSQALTQAHLVLDEGLS